MILIMIMPVLLTVVPVMLYQTVLLLCGKKATVTHYFWTCLMMIYVWLVFSVTGIGSIWDILSKGGLSAVLQQANVGLVPFQSGGVFTYAMNVIMLMPLGFLLPYIWKNFRNPVKTALAGLAFSGFIEFAQLPTNRLADADDLLMNTAGAVAGYVVWKIIGKHFFHKKEKLRTVSLGRSEPVICLGLACAGNFLLYDWRWFL